MYFHCLASNQKVLRLDASRFVGFGTTSAEIDGRSLRFSRSQTNVGAPSLPVFGKGGNPEVRCLAKRIPLRSRSACPPYENRVGWGTHIRVVHENQRQRVGHPHTYPNPDLNRHQPTRLAAKMGGGTAAWKPALRGGTTLPAGSRRYEQKGRSRFASPFRFRLSSLVGLAFETGCGQPVSQMN